MTETRTVHLEDLEDIIARIICCNPLDYEAQSRDLHAAVDEIMEAVREHYKPKWQPIETAPKNTSILIYIPNCEHYGPGIYRAIWVDSETGQRWHCTAPGMGRDLALHDYPTHWMPLPQNPTHEEE